MNKISKQILLAFLMFIFIGCNNEDDLGPGNEEFTGVYIVESTEFAMDDKMDSVYFTVFRNTTFSMLFYEGAGSGQMVDFCDCEGNILDFGTARASFDPTYIDTGGCDTARVPRGLFTADFINNDSLIILERRITYESIYNSSTFDSVFQLLLLKE